MKLIACSLPFYFPLDEMEIFEFVKQFTIKLSLQIYEKEYIA